MDYFWKHMINKSSRDSDVIYGIALDDCMSITAIQLLIMNSQPFYVNNRKCIYNFLQILFVSTNKLLWNIVNSLWSF